MKVVITGRVGDSAGVAECGRVEFSQAQRFDDGAMQITGSIAVANVVLGELRTLDGGSFTLPSNPEGTAVRIREMFGGQTFEWWAAVPEVASIEYRELPIMESGDVPGSVWGAPPWVASLTEASEQTIAAVEAGMEVAEALGGLSGISGMVDDAAAAAAAAAQSADRAEAAADSIDMTELNARIDGKVSTVTGPSVLYGTGPAGEPVSVPRSVNATSGTVPVRGAGGVIAGVGAPAAAGHAANRGYVDGVRDGLRAQIAAAVTHEAVTLAGGVLCNVFRLSTGGKHVEGVVSKSFAAGPRPPANDAGNLTTTQMSRKSGVSFVANGSGWTNTDGKIRGPNFADGVANGVLSNSHPQDNAAVAYCEDGLLRYYEHALGDTVAKMKADGVLHSWSWGPKIIQDDRVFNYAASGGWGSLNTTTKSARTVLGQAVNGDLVIFQIYGVSGSSGMNVPEVAAALAGRGLRVAVMLDGGGSTQSSWGGKIAHVSSDPTTRKLPDFVCFNARQGGVMSLPPVQLQLKAPFSGELLASLEDGVCVVAGNVSGNSAPNTNPQLTEDGSMPLWIRNVRGRGMVRGGGGVIGFAKLSTQAIHITSPAINNPDVYIECDANYGMD